MVKYVKNVMKFLCSAAFCFIFAIGATQVAKAEGEGVAINETNFPDGVFRDYIKTFDKDNSNGLSEEEIANIKTIDVNSKNVYSLEGIEYFTAMTKLSCAVTPIKSLDVSNNTSLTWLSCGCGPLANLNLNGATALKTLSCQTSLLVNLDLSTNTALTYLEIYDNNHLVSLDISHNTALTWLNCISNNKLERLNANGAKALTKLWCYDNHLTSIDVSGATAVKELRCYNNQLASLDVSHNTALTFLGCAANQLTSLDVSHNTALTSLSCSTNQLTSLDVSHNTALTSLSCFTNQLTGLKLNNQSYNKLSLRKKNLHGDNVVLSDLKNITETIDKYEIPILQVIDITKPATYKVNGKDFTIIYTAPVIPEVTPTPFPSATPGVIPTSSPSATPGATPSPSVIPSASASPIPPADHMFSDYNHNNLLAGTAIMVYGNGTNLTVDGKKVNNKVFTVYTDILASYKYTLNSKGVVKPSVGKVIVGITKSNVKPEVDSKNKITDKSASKIAKATIKNGQIKITALGKEGGLVYLWVIDTGNKGVSECYPVDVKLAPRKLEVQDTSGSKLTNTKLGNGKTLDVCVAGIVSGSVKTDDCTYTATVDPKYQNYITVTPVTGSADKFTIEAKGLNNNKDTKAAVTFKCDQNGKKVKFSLTVTK